jgi:pyruvate/oxaloacetate carboxyltransferase
LGYSSDIDEEALETVSAHFRKIAEKEGLPVGAPEEYDLFHFEHQVPGGMMTNLKRQLKELGMEHRLEEVLEEIILVRKEFGYPVMATPFSQIVGAQSVENVVLGERYRRVPDEAIKYVMGYYGEPATPIEPNVMDRIMNLPEAKKFLNWKPQGRYKSIKELRQEMGSEFSDDELLLRVLIPGRTVKRNELKEKVIPTPDVVSTPAKAMAPNNSSLDFPMAFSVDVDGEVFSVKVTPVRDQTDQTREVERPKTKGPGELP